MTLDRPRDDHDAVEDQRQDTDHQPGTARAQMSRRVDPATGRTMENLPRRGRAHRREPSSVSVEHLRYDWFPLRVVPGKERLARILLEDRGLVTFCPVETRWRNANRADRARRNKRRMTYPLHPGLVFVGLTQPYRWADVFAAPVVRSVISLAPDRPRRIRHDAVWRLMVRFGQGRFVRPDEQRWMATGAEFGVGDTVRVTSGVMEGRRFEVAAITGSTARLFGHWFGAELGFEVPTEILAQDESSGLVEGESVG